jgi:hypothetical protein
MAKAEDGSLPNKKVQNTTSIGMAARKPINTIFCANANLRMTATPGVKRPADCIRIPLYLHALLRCMFCFPSHTVAP